MDPVMIAGRPVGAGARCFVIAEAGVNHNGNLDLGLRLVDAAADAGADAVKFQTFSAERLASRYAPQFPYVERGAAGPSSQLEMLRRLELPLAWHAPLRRQCERRGILFLSTPFDEASADWLDDFGVSVFKVPSGELTNLPLLAHVARKGRPVILSTGMATLGEVARAVEAVTDSATAGLIVLHCVSDYPANAADANLRAMHTLRRAFGVPVGYSDHTAGVPIALAAVALGAAVIEKHLTIDRRLPGPDHRASLEPGELTDLVAGIRLVESSLGTGIKRPAPSELKTRACVRKSIVAARDLTAGEHLSPDVVAIRRPGDGLSPDVLPLLLGRRLGRDVEAGRPIGLDDLS